MPLYTGASHPRFNNIDIAGLLYFVVKDTLIHSL